MMLSHGLLTNLHSASCPLSPELPSRISGSGAVQGPQAAHCFSCRSDSVPSSLAHVPSLGCSPHFHKDFFGINSLLSRQQNCAERGCRILPVAPRAVLTTDPAASEATKEFSLDGGLELKAKAVGARGSSPAHVEFQAKNCSDSLFLHWGLTRSGQKDWIIPSHLPDGTRVFKKRALQTPFHKSGDIAFLTVEVHDASVNAIEFILKDESSNTWFKLHGGNFRIVLPKSNINVAQTPVPEELVPVPEELVQVQAYIRWERKGKQKYSAEQEREEYEEARKELQHAVAQGVSIESLQSRLLGGETRDSDGVSSTSTKIPQELVQVQAYLRWEKAGKPKYSPEEELREFEAARKELENEVLNGVSVEKLRKRLQPGGGKSGSGSSAATKVAAPTRKGVARIQRKKWDVSELINRYSAVKVETAVSIKEPTALEMGAQVMEGADNGAIVLKKNFKLGGNDLLVLVTNPGGEIRVRLASNLKEPLSLHWAVSKHSNGEWQTPPENIIPENSTLLQGSCETPFKQGFAGEPSLQSLEILVGDAGILGIPFVLRSGGNWLKNGGSDFYIPMKAEEKQKIKQALGDGKHTVKWLLDEIGILESDAERSLMHRFNIAADLTGKAKNEGVLALAGILVWMRFMATRQLTWNKNYNVKPREISAAQDRLTDLLQAMFRDQPENREIIRLIMSTVGRGGRGDVGQRIRDEILVIQRNNDCKGGMMEEWHQKLHNNTSPDDVVICQALLDYIQNDFNIDYYWKTLNANGVSKERLRSYDRPIVSEPRFRADQKGGLVRDLSAYLRTLKAVHSGADLESAIETCMGYSSKGDGFMGGVEIRPISDLSQDLPALLQFVMDHVEDKQVIPLLEGLLEARRELRRTLLKHHDRLRDIIFLDLALDSTVRTAVERGLEGLSNAAPADIIFMISLVLENLCLSSDNNEELVYCLKEWHNVLEFSKVGGDKWALRAKAVLDRTRLALADKAEHYQEILQPTAIYLGGLLGVEQWAIDIFTEEMIRAGSAASLSQLVNRLDPLLRAAAHLGSWQVISPVEVQGYVVVVGDLGEVQDKVYDRPTILVATRVKGEEEIPDGAVAVLTPDMPDVLSHVSVRARNSKVCFATCFDSKIFSDLQSKEGKPLKVQPTSADLVYSEVTDTEASKGSSGAFLDGPPPEITLKRKSFSGSFAVAADEFNGDLVGAKSRNIAYLKGKLPSWIRVPTSVALPFGVFEKVLSEDVNKDVASAIAALEKDLVKGDFSKLHDIREIVLQLKAPLQLVNDLENKMKGSNMAWPGDEGIQRWEQAWMAIKKVWASKWNERAFFSTRKAKIDHNDLCMAVLVQEIVRADYAFVIHTVNPSNGDASEIYAEVVKGLGETLVGAYSGRALSFVSQKSDLKSPKILGYPSKRIGLFIKQSIIFRSDSNGEDLEGYAGAGLYDSVPMDEEEERIVDYSSDPLVIDQDFQRFILSRIAEAGAAVEELYGSAQDIEGVIKDGELYIVQTRPQM